MGFVFFNFLCQGERRTNVRAEIIDNNLPFFLLFFLFEGFIGKPFIDQTHKGIDAAQTDGCFFISQLLYSLGVAATPFRIHLTGMVVFVFLFFLVILSVSFTKSNDT